MTSIRVHRGSPEHKTLREQGWREDIQGAELDTVWLNAPGRYRVEVTYNGKLSTFEYIEGVSGNWIGHERRQLVWFQDSIGLDGDTSEQACDNYFQSLVSLACTSQPVPQGIEVDIFDTAECIRIYHDAARHPDHEQQAA